MVEQEQEQKTKRERKRERAVSTAKITWIAMEGWYYNLLTWTKSVKPKQLQVSV